MVTLFVVCDAVPVIVAGLFLSFVFGIPGW